MAVNSKKGGTAFSAVVKNFMQNTYIAKTGEELFSYQAVLLNSQKAKGIFWIEQNLPFNSLPAIYLKPNQEITEELLERLPYPVFIRPCPVEPRPGVLESDVAHQKESFRFIFKYLSRKMLEKHEENGDIVIQPYKHAIANIVWSAGIMVIGPDHNGATKGTYPSIIANALPPDFYRKAMDDLSLPAADIEMIIESDMTVWVTQIRSTHARTLFLAPGPKGAFSGLLSHSPLKVSDNRIITIKNLKGIDELCEQMQDNEENIIVYHPNGSPLSHIANMCQKKHYSYVTVDVASTEWISEPTRGWVIKGSSLQEKYPIDYYPDDFFGGIEAGVESLTPVSVRRMWKTILPFHHYVYHISLCKNIAYLSGVFVGTLLKAALTIAVRKAWQLTKQTDICPGIKEKLNPRNFSNGFNTYTLCAVALQVPYEQFAPAFNSLSEYFQGISPTKSREIKQWQDTMEICLLLTAKIADRNREDVLHFALMLLETLRQIPVATIRLLDRDDVYSMLHLAIPQTWSKTAQAWSQSLNILRDRMPNAEI